MTVDESAWDCLTPNKNESGREFKLFESAWESITAHESLRPKENESSYSLRARGSR